MKVVHVIPISKGILLERLSYFTSEDVRIGSTVVVPLRKKKVYAIVTHIEDVEAVKSDLRNSTFALRKMEHVESHSFVHETFIESTKEVGEYYIASTGSVLHTLLPKAILAGLSLVKEINTDIKKKNSNGEQLALQADDEERFSQYKSLIREEFAQQRSIYMCVPTIEDGIRAQHALEKGIEQYTYVFHSGLTKKKTLELWNAVLAEQHPVLVIATGQYMCIPRSDIGTIIVEREGSRAYKTPTRPFIDIRTFLGIYAKKIGARLLLGDMLLRTETVWKLKHDEYVEFSPLKFRSVTRAEQIVVDTRKSDIHDEQKNKHFSTLSPELLRLIEWNKERSENLFIFAVRKGLAPLTLCGDCGTVATCSVCSTPVVLHGGASADEERYFECHTCGKRRGAKELCKTCGGWKLTTLGVGIERIEQEIKELFPTVRIFRLDTQSALTHKKASDLVTAFYNTPGSVLLGTEMALLYIQKQIENVAIASIDPLFSLPDFRVGEKILSILLKIRSLAKENVLLQTRNPSERIFNYALQGNLADFYRDEIQEREQFEYPPFSTFIKITIQGEEKIVAQEAKKIAELCTPYPTDIFPAFTSKVKGKHIMHVLIKIPRSAWVDQELLATLRSLPPQIMVKVDPETIL